MVFYRKYRPQKISELDITKVRERLSSILKSGDIPHAFLFAGPKGLGKTSAARILAKAINCERLASSKPESVSKNKKLNSSSYSLDAGIEPCNACDVCTSITNGSNLDVIEIDAASNRGIEEIRALREKIKFSPVSLKKKIYIIDEVHMLTIEAFNALLKTLEEPPSHAVFILCTTEPWRLPDTIISRTFFVQFEKPIFEELKRSLERVVKGEKLEIDENLYEQIHVYSEGSFRDAAKIIEELSLSSEGKAITRELFESVFKAGTIKNEVESLLKYLASRKVKDALQIVENLSQNGVDFRMVIEKAVDCLRINLLSKSGIDESKEKEASLEDLNELSIGEINNLTELFSKAYKDLRFSVLPSLPLEMLIVKWCVIKEDQISNPSASLPSNHLRAGMARIKDQKLEEDNIDDRQNKTNSLSQKPSDSSDDFLKRLIEEVKKENHTIAGILRGCKLVERGEKNFKLETGYKFHFEKLSDVNVRRIIEKKASEILEKEISVNIQMKK